MRDSKTATLAIAVLFAISGCATMREREWGSCAVAGALIGGTVGGVTGGVATNNSQDPSNGERGAAIGGGLVAGALIGALLGHAICDPMKAPPPPPPPPPPPAPRVKLGELGAAHFDFNKAEVKPAGAEILNGIVRTLKEHPTEKVEIEGYTDSVGSDAYNMKLSERRAEAIRNYLVRQGIEASRISTQGFGKTKPIADNNTAEGRARNRRAEIFGR